MSCKKVMLIVPPRTVNADFLSRARIASIPPLGLLYLAAHLEKRGYQLRIGDCLMENFEARRVGPETFRYGMTNEQILAMIRDFGPDYIGVSCMFTTNYGDFRQLCSLIKSHFDVPLIAGGAHVTAEWERVLTNDPVDFVVLGEGELSLAELLECLESGSDFRSVLGVAYGYKGMPTANFPVQYVDDLDELGTPAYHLIHLSRYVEQGFAHADIRRGVIWAPIVTSRGCPHKCSFCFARGINGTKIRLRSVDTVMEEIRLLESTCHVEEIHIEDDNFTHNTDRAVAILEQVAELGLKLVFPNGLAVYSLENDRILRALKRNDVTSLTVAIESGDDRVLRTIMRKPVTIRLAKRVREKLKANGFNVKGFFILGMPGETVDSLRNTYNLVKQLGLDWNGFNIAAPLPGTDMTRVCVENGYLNKSLAGNLEYVNFAQSVIDTPYLDHEQVNKYLHYFNVMSNFIEMDENCTTPSALEYKLQMYERVARQVPRHKYAAVSAARVKLREVILSMRNRGQGLDNEIHSLEAVESMLKESQLKVLRDDLEEMPGRIVEFHTLEPSN